MKYRTIEPDISRSLQSWVFTTHGRTHSWRVCNNFIKYGVSLQLWVWPIEWLIFSVKNTKKHRRLGYETRFETYEATTTAGAVWCMLCALQQPEKGARRIDTTGACSAVRAWSVLCGARVAWSRVPEFPTHAVRVHIPQKNMCSVRLTHSLVCFLVSVCEAEWS